MAGEKFSMKLITFLSGFDGFTAYAVILGVLFACGLGVPIPEDITLLAAGILAALDKISFEGAMVADLLVIALCSLWVENLVTEFLKCLDLKRFLLSGELALQEIACFQILNLYVLSQGSCPG